MPAFAWNPSVNPTNVLFYTGTAFAGWRGSLLVSGLGSKQIQRLTINQRAGRRPTGSCSENSASAFETSARAPTAPCTC